MCKRFFIGLLIFMSTFPCLSQNILFDIFGVLFHIPIGTQIVHMGLTPLQYLAFDHKNPKTIRSLFLDVLLQVPVSKELMDYFSANNKGSQAAEKPMSAIMYLWQANQISGEEALKITLRYIEDMHSKKFFCSSYEKEMLEKATYMAFEFETRKKAYQPLDAGIKLLKRCAEEKDSNGKKAHSLYVLSNMDKEMMTHLQTTYPEIFGLFDGIVISADTESLKPDSAIFKHVLETFDLKPEETIFIDDQEENILGAQALGIKGILCQDFESVSEELKDNKIISPVSSTSMTRLIPSNKTIATILGVGLLAYCCSTHCLRLFTNQTNSNQN